MFDENEDEALQRFTQELARERPPKTQARAQTFEMSRKPDAGARSRNFSLPSARFHSITWLAIAIKSGDKEIPSF